MIARQLTLVSPSGGSVGIDLPSDSQVASIAAGARFAGGSYGTGFQIGPRGYHDFACTYVVPAKQRERILVYGREVIIAEAVTGESSVATLIGDYHELMTVYAGPAPHRERVFSLFSSLLIEDRVEGMRIKPRSATLLDTMNEQVIVVVRDRGSISVPGPRQARALAPRHRGALTRYGEVWRIQLPGVAAASRARDFGYLIGFASAVAEVSLADTDTVPDSQLLDWLYDLNVTWRDAA
jgi:hypothetical protein